MNGAMVLYNFALDCAVSIIAVPEALMTSLVQVYGQQLAA